MLLPKTHYRKELFLGKIHIKRIPPKEHFGGIRFVTYSVCNSFVNRNWTKSD